jgi:pilus assembly protein CpaC
MALRLCHQLRGTAQVKTLRNSQGALRLRRLAAGLAALVAFAAVSMPALAQTVSYDLSTTSVMRINLPVSQAVTVAVSAPVGKIVAADPTIADAQPITDKSLYLVGKTFGTTTVNLYSATGAPVGLLAVQVGADTGGMARAIRQAVPDSHVRVSTANGRVLLSGTVSDQNSMQKVLDIVAQYGSPAVINAMTLSGGQPGDPHDQPVLDQIAGPGRSVRWWFFRYRAAQSFSGLCAHG